MSTALERQMNDLVLLATDRMVEYKQMFTALAKLVCPECDHELQHHVDEYGCEIERGDREGDESGPAYALGPCGCSDADLEDYPDFVRALEAFRKAKEAK